MSVSRTDTRRVTNGSPPGVFAMQYGPGAENAYAGVATAFSDAVPMLLLPLGYPSDRDGVYPNFSSVRSYESDHQERRATKGDHTWWLKPCAERSHVSRWDRPGPVMVEIPSDVGAR